MTVTVTVTQYGATFVSLRRGSHSCKIWVASLLKWRISVFSFIFTSSSSRIMAWRCSTAIISGSAGALVVRCALRSPRHLQRQAALCVNYAPLYCTVLYCIVLYCIVLYCIVCIYVSAGRSVCRLLVVVFSCFIPGVLFWCFLRNFLSSNVITRTHCCSLHLWLLSASMTHDWLYKT